MSDCFTIDSFNIALIKYFDPNMLKSPFKIYAIGLTVLKEAKNIRKLSHSSNRISGRR